MIGVVGATGFTGRLVASRLQELNAQFCLLGRSLPRLEKIASEIRGVPTRRINVLDSSTFGALEGCDVVINCAGPFIQLGEPIVREAVARRIHYLDTTGEQAFIKLAYDKYGASAREQQIALVPACAFEYALGDAAGTLVLEQLPDCDTLEIVYWVEGMHASAGTKKSAILAMTSPGFQLLDQKLVELPPAAIIRRLEIDGRSRCAFSFPGGEVLMLPMHASIHSVATLIALDLPQALISSLATASRILLKSGLSKIVIALVDALAGEPTTEQRISTRFTMVCTGSSSSGSRQLTISGADPYWVTAAIVAGLAGHLDRHQPVRGGALSPAMVAGAELIQNITSSVGVSWTAQ